VSPEQLLGELERQRQIVVGDLEAGTGTVLRLKDGQADVVVVVAQPTAKSIDIAARAARTAVNRGTRVVVLANRVRCGEDVDAIRAALGDREVVAIPDDPGIARADREGRAPIDVAPDGPGVRAIVGVAERLAGASGA
jgi:CO dehydrogenase maturation factor